MEVFILGIAGGTGRRLAEHLISDGDAVAGLCRRQEQTVELQALGVRTAVGDLANMSENALASAMSGADAIVFTAGAGEQDDDSMIDAIDGNGARKATVAAQLADVSRFLLVSVFPDAWRGNDMSKSFEHYMAVKKRADVDLVHSGLDWLILRPSSLTDGAETGRVSLSPAEIHSSVSRADVAATIAALLHSPSIRRRVLEVTGGSTPIPRAIRGLQEP